MPAPKRNVFREYVTGTAFSLQLCKTHIWALAHIGANTLGYHERSKGPRVVSPAIEPLVDNFVGPVKALIARGLVEHNPNWGKNKRPAYSLTPAGEHVLALLKLAELVYESGTSREVA